MQSESGGLNLMFYAVWHAVVSCEQTLEYVNKGLPDRGLCVQVKISDRFSALTIDVDEPPTSRS